MPGFSDRVARISTPTPFHCLWVAFATLTMPVVHFGCSREDHLARAILKEDEPAVRELLYADCARLSHRSEQLCQALAEVDDEFLSAVLTACPALVNCKGEGGRTPLMAAAGAPMHPVQHVSDPDEVRIQILLQWNPSVNDSDDRGNSALTYASMFGSARMVRALLQHGAAATHVNNTGDSPLHFAAMTSPAMVQSLLEAGADVNLANSAGQTPLMLAAGFGMERLNTVRVLLRAGSRADLTDVQGRSAIDYVTIRGLVNDQTDVTDLLNSSLSTVRR